jgi:hypothetical protein
LTESNERKQQRLERILSSYRNTHESFGKREIDFEFSQTITSVSISEASIVGAMQGRRYYVQHCATLAIFKEKVVCVTGRNWATLGEIRRH